MIRCTLLSHKEKLFRRCFKHTQIIQNVNTQLRIKIWTDYIKTSAPHQLITTKWNIIIKLY